MADLLGGSTKIDLMTGGQRKLLKDITDTLREQWGQAGPVYEGQVVPGATPLMQQGFGLAGQDIAGLQPALSTMLSGQADPQAVQEYYQAAVAAPAQQQFRDVMRQVGSQFGGTYGTTGALPKAMAQAGEDFATNLSGQLAGLQFGERQQALGRQQAAVPLALGARQQQLSQLLGAGGMQRGLEAQQNQEALARWTQAQPYANPWVTSYLGPALNTQAFGYGNQPGLLGQIGSLVSGIGQMGMGAGMLATGNPLGILGLGGGAMGTAGAAGQM